MTRRRQARTARGRYTRNTLENTVGLSVLVCQECRRMNPYPAGGDKPTTCHACGSEHLQ